jgi:hypothetical protein
MREVVHSLQDAGKRLEGDDRRRVSTLLSNRRDPERCRELVNTRRTMTEWRTRHELWETRKLARSLSDGKLTRSSEV